MSVSANLNVFMNGETGACVCVRVCVCACVRAYVRACKAGIVNENDTRVSSALPGIVTHVMM